MKNKSVFSVAIISLVIFIGIAAYLWYLYFYENEEKLIKDNCSSPFSSVVELVNTGKINYVDADPLDSDNIIPIYYFSVKNSSDKDYDYIIVIEETAGDDGCTEANRLKKSELEYELKLDNKVIRQGGLETIDKNILDTNVIKGNSVNDYSLKIKLKSETTDYQNKHFHYVVNIKEKE